MNEREPNAFSQDEPQPESIEHKSPEHLAEEKLQRLESNSFDAFAVRFMNIEEYQRLLIEQNPPAPREWNEFRYQTFREFMRDSSEDWQTSVEFLTDWTPSTEGLDMQKELVHRIEKAKQGAKREIEKNPELGKTTTVRQQAMKSFQKNLLWEMEKEATVRSAVIPQLSAQIQLENQGGKYGVFSEIIMKERTKLLTRDDLDALKKEYADPTNKTALPEETVIAIHKFFTNPEDITKQELRAIVQELAEMRGSETFGFRGTKTRQYQVGVIFELQDTSNGMGETQYWNQGELGAENHILGAIVTTPNRELLEKVVQIASKSGDRAHPVIDSHNLVQFPKNSRGKQIFYNELDLWMKTELSEVQKEPLFLEYWSEVAGIADEREKAALQVLMDKTPRDIERWYMTMRLEEIDGGKDGGYDYLKNPPFTFKKSYLSGNESPTPYFFNAIKKVLTHLGKKILENPSSAKIYGPGETVYTEEGDAGLRYIRGKYANQKNLFSPDAENMLTIGQCKVPAALFESWNSNSAALQEIQKANPQHYGLLDRLNFEYIRMQEEMKRVQENTDYDPSYESKLHLSEILLLESNAQELKKRGEKGVVAASFITQSA